MDTPRKSSRKTKVYLSTSSEDEEEVINEFFKSKLPPGTNCEKTPLKNNLVPEYVTRSGRKVIKRFEDLQLSTKEKERIASSDSSSPVAPEGEQPSALFEDDKAIESNIFGFHTPRRKHSMLVKATDSVSKTPKDAVNTPKTLKETRNAAGIKGTRTRMKRRINREAARQQYSVEDSDSEYHPSESSSNESSSSSDEDAVPLSDDQKSSPEPEPVRTRGRKPRGADSNFIFTSDDYFERQGAKSVTSDHNLNRLKNPKLHQDQLMELLKDVNPRHKTVLKELDFDNQSMFKRWLIAMGQGFNVLLYGVGSKRTLLNSFHAKHLSSCASLIVNGYFPDITIKDILDTLAASVLKIKNVPGQPHEVLDAIAAKMKSPKEQDVFIIMHNLDGTALRLEKTQSVLAELAGLPKVHLVASIDHINSPLLWNQNKLSQFNFIWEDATTFLPYFEETSFESSLLVQRSGTIALAALRNVFQSLNLNARKVFGLLMEHNLNNVGKNYQGMLFSDLYRACRNAFIVSSDLALRTQLTEFFDHKLVRHKKDTDHLKIPIDSDVLRQFNDEIHSGD